MSDSLFGALYARGDAAAEVTDRAWFQAMLDVEAALARACARVDEIPPQAAEAIVAACRPDRFDLAEIGRSVAKSTTPVAALVSAMRDAVGSEVAPYVHRGATSQDVIDTAAMLVAQRALVPLLNDAQAAAEAAASMAEANRATPMAGRTLLRLALPTSFGLRAAGWLVGLDEARAGLAAVSHCELAVQMGGPVGGRRPAIATEVAAELGLTEPTLPWHTIRIRPAALSAALGLLAGVAAKIARDVILLGQDEVGELSEGDAPGRGRSSAMAHKCNPVAAVSVLACAGRVPALVATMLAGMVQEHERAAGGWQAEWGTLTELLALTGSTCAWLRDLLERLQVRPVAMRENLVRLAEAGVAEAAEPERHLAAASELIDRALAAHRQEAG